MTEKIGLIGLGYVGLPAAVAFARVFPGVIGFDINKRRIESLKSGVDTTGEITSADLKKANLTVTDDASALRDSTFFIVTVPTPIDDLQRPDLTPLESACKTIAPALKKNDLVV